MKPVEQRVVSPDAGDCFSACIASILELPLERVPTIHGDNSWDRWMDWFEAANASLVLLDSNPPPPGYAIRSILSYAFEARTHAVVSFNGVVVWDPSPHRRDLADECYGQWTRHWIIVPLDPTQPIDRERLLS
jgi:hypothetical protein